MSKHRVDIILGAIDRTSPTVRGMGRTLRRDLASAARVAAAGVAAVATSTAAGAAGTALLVRQSLALVDAQAKTSARLGISVQALRELSFAAEQSGLNARTLELAMQRMTRRVAEAAQGGGVAASALEELGLSAETLNTATPDQARLRIADGFEGVTNQADRVRLAFKLFDTEGVRLLNLIQNGSGAVRSLTSEFRQLAGEISAMDARGIEAVNDAMNSIRTSIRGAIDSLTVELAPAITTVANMATSALSDARSGADSVRDAGRGIVNTIADMLDGISAVSRTGNHLYYHLANWYATLSGFYGRVISQINNLRQALADLLRDAAAGQRTLTSATQQGIAAASRAVPGSGLVASVASQYVGSTGSAAATGFSGAADALDQPVVSGVLRGAQRATEVWAEAMRALAQSQADAINAPRPGDRFRNAVEQARSDAQSAVSASDVPTALLPLIDALDANTEATDNATRVGAVSIRSPSLFVSDTLSGAQFRDPTALATIRTADNTKRTADALATTNDELARLREVVSNLTRSFRTGTPLAIV